MLQAVTNSAPAKATPAAAIPLTVLDNLAARFRPGGLCLLMLNADGSFAYHDSQAGLFFQRFAIPMVQYPDPAAELAGRVAAMSAGSGVEIWNVLPGVVIAAFPFVEKRNLAGVLLLAGK